MLGEGIGGAFQLTGRGLGGGDPYRAIGGVWFFSQRCHHVKKGARAHLRQFPSRPWVTHPPSWAGWIVERKGKAAVVSQRLGDPRSQYLQEVNMSRVEAKCAIT